MNTRQIISSDSDLLDCLLDRSKEREAIMYIYENYFEQLSIFVQQNGGSGDDAQDIFQEVVLSFVHLVKQHKYRGESSIKTFLFAINRNLWFNELKRKGRQAVREIKYETEATNDQEDIETVLEQNERGRELLRLFKSLGDTCKKILHLFYYENYAIKDLLPVLGYDNEQVVRNKKYKCLRKLEEMITEQKGFSNQLKKLLHG